MVVCYALSVKVALQYIPTKSTRFSLSIYFQYP